MQALAYLTSRYFLQVKRLAMEATGLELFLPSGAWLDEHLALAEAAGLDAAQMERWWSTVAVWLVLEAGYHVLWQASNVVWLSDPWIHLYSKAKEGKANSYGENEIISRCVEGACTMGC
jgi:hypothetical protein